MDANSFHPLMHDRGRGPELRSCRITVYDLIPYLEGVNYSDQTMLDVWPVSSEELEVLKRFIVAHRDEVMAVHQRIEERIRREMAEQATPEFLSRFWWNSDRLCQFKKYLADLMPDVARPAEHPKDYFRHRREFRAKVEGSEKGHATTNGSLG